MPQITYYKSKKLISSSQEFFAVIKIVYDMRKLSVLYIRLYKATLWSNNLSIVFNFYTIV